MAYIITDDCVNCGACAPECPVECISEGNDIHVINPEECIECGACAGVCPRNRKNKLRRYPLDRDRADYHSTV